MPKVKARENLNLRAVRELLEWKGWKVVRLNTGAFPITDRNGKTRYVKTGTRGLPDLLALKETYPPIFIEVKGEGGKLSKHQKEMIDLINKTTARATVVWTPDEMVDYLAGLDEEVSNNSE